MARGAPRAVPRGSVASLACRRAMDSVPATVPSVSASPGDSELLGPLSVFFAALIAKLLEVTVPLPGGTPGRLVAVPIGAGALTDGAREKRGPGPGRRDPAALLREAAGAGEGSWSLPAEPLAGSGRRVTPACDRACDRLLSR